MYTGSLLLMIQGVHTKHIYDKSKPLFSFGIQTVFQLIHSKP